MASWNGAEIECKYNEKTDKNIYSYKQTDDAECMYCKLKKEYDAGIHVSPIYRVGSMQYNKYISLGYEPFDYTTYEELQ